MGLRMTGVWAAWVLCLVGCAALETKGGGATGEESFRGGIARVSNRSWVCMGTDLYMGQPQMPLPLAGRTYYTCCAMCQKRLTLEPEVRRAVDPYSRRSVDKSAAVTARDRNGKALYFESEENLRRYQDRVAEESGTSP